MKTELIDIPDEVLEAEFYTMERIEADANHRFHFPGDFMDVQPDP